MIRFVEKPHSVTGATMIEVWDDSRFLAAIYGGATGSDAPMVRVVSRHISLAVPERPDADGVAAVNVIFR